MPDPVKAYLREISINAGPYDPADDTLVCVINNLDARVPFRLFDTGRDRTMNAVITGGNVEIPIQFTDYFILDLTEDINTWTFGALPWSGRAATVSIRINQGPVPKLLVWPDSFWWAGDAPLISMEANRTDLLVLTTHDEGVTWLADLARGYREPTP